MATTRERIHRCLSLLRRLQIGPADRETLMDHVAIDLGPDTYDERKSPKARESRFSKDVAFLRDVLGVEISVDRRAEGYEYQLKSFGEFQPLALNDADLEALAFLAQTFSAGALRGREVSALLARIKDILWQNQRDRLELLESRYILRMEAKEAERVSRRVQQTVERALRERRALQFSYRTPAQADGAPRLHTVHPYAVAFDPARGHLYLDAYWLTSEGPPGRFRQDKWQRFRLDRILDDERLRLLPDRLPYQLPRRPRYRLEYWLAPVIAGHGQVTRHFDAMEVHETDEHGWVRVTGVTDDLFRAVRLLLSYGPNCRVTGGPEARREMEKLVRGMAALYDRKGAR